jgi:hypothetical protein
MLLALWGLLERWTPVAEKITVDRDGGAACRVAAFVAAEGFLLGHAVNGWAETGLSQETAARFAGAAFPWVAGLLVERTFRPRAGPPRRADLVIGLAYLEAAGAWVWLTR